VLALEPDPRLLPVLLANIRHNGLSQVTALGVAAADRECEVELVGFDWSAGTFGLTRMAGPQETGQAPRFTVPGDTLDRILRRQRVDSVDLLKMDIEGAESLALEGLRPMLMTSRIHRLLIELHPGHLVVLGTNAEQAIEPLLAAGYRGYEIDARRAGRPVPLGSKGSLDPWPHQLWTAPGVALTGTSGSRF
jgi:FkbM family methyltransferase